MQIEWLVVVFLDFLSLLFSLEIFLLALVLNSMYDSTQHKQWYDFYWVKKEPNNFWIIEEKTSHMGMST